MNNGQTTKTMEMSASMRKPPPPTLSSLSYIESDENNDGSDSDNDEEKAMMISRPLSKDEQQEQSYLENFEIDDEEEEEEEEEEFHLDALPHDTFSMLMLCRYPIIDTYFYNFANDAIQQATNDVIQKASAKATTTITTVSKQEGRNDHGDNDVNHNVVNENLPTTTTNKNIVTKNNINDSAHSAATSVASVKVGGLVVLDVKSSTTETTKQGQHEEEQQPSSSLPEEQRQLTSSPSSRRRRKIRKNYSEIFFFPFCLGFFVLICQVFAYTVVIVHAFSDDPPPNVDRTLRYTQLFAMIVTLYTQTDFIEGVTLLTEGYQPFKDVTSRFKYLFSALGRIVLGNAGMLSTFVLVMYSTEVVEMLLNFTAMEFVTALESAAFVLATKGFFGRKIVAKTTEIEQFRYKSRLPKYSRCRWYFGYSTAVFVAFGVFWYLQSERLIGVDNEVYVQLEGTATPELFSISGVYKGCKGYRTKSTGDVGYIDVNVGGGQGVCPKRNNHDPVYPDTFIYCWDLDGWVFVREETNDPCNPKNYILRSILDDGGSDADSFDLLKHSRARWVVKRSQYGGEAFLQHFFIDSPKNFEDSKFIGCNVLEVDGHDFQMLNTTYYPIYREKDAQPLDGDAEGVRFTDAFELMYRPLYYTQDEERGDDGIFRVVLFDGLHWMLMDLNPREFSKRIEEDEGNDIVCIESDFDPYCWEVFLQEFHSNREWLFDDKISNVIAMSDPMYLLTESDTGFPTADLEWHRVESFKKEYLEFEEEIDILVQCAIKDLACEDDERSLRLSVLTDEFPDQTTVLAFYGNELKDMESLKVDYTLEEAGEDEIEFTSFGKVELLHMVFHDSNEDRRHDLTTCVPETECIQVVIIDSAGDGLDDPGRFDIYYDDIRVTGFAGSSEDSDDTEFSCLSFQVGNGCAVPRPEGQEAVECELETITEYHPDSWVATASTMLLPFDSTDNKNIESNTP